MATSSFGKKYAISPKNEKAFLSFMSEPAKPIRSANAKSCLVSSDRLRSMRGSKKA